MLTKLLAHIISSPSLHALWLNTLSYLENCGARKIAACEHPTLVKEEMLKHASEEFRHAHYLKSQIERLGENKHDYSITNILGGFATLRYLDRLDLFTMKTFRKKELAYLLVTYAIEKRAESLYPLYDSLLRHHNSKIMVKSILLEEKEHLEEMTASLKKIPSGMEYAERVLEFEQHLYDKWITCVAHHVSCELTGALVFCDQ